MAKKQNQTNGSGGFRPRARKHGAVCQRGFGRAGGRPRARICRQKPRGDHRANQGTRKGMEHRAADRIGSADDGDYRARARRGGQPKFLVLPAFVFGMVALHGIQGWYPMIPLFRRMGFRSRKEIDREKFALKALRGDFNEISNGSGGDEAERVEKIFAAVRS